MAFEPFRVETIAATEEPQRLIYTAMRTALTDDYLPAWREALLDGDESQEFPDVQEDRCGQHVVKRLLNCDSAKPSWCLYSPLEHPCLTLQIRADQQTLNDLARSAKNISFDLQSMRMVGRGLNKLISNHSYPVEELFFCRQPGHYLDHSGNRCPWTDEDLEDQLAACLSAVIDYNNRLREGNSEEQALQGLPNNVLVNATATGSLRAWLQLINARNRPNNLYEMRNIAELISDHVARWVPEIYSWWSSHEKSKDCLSV